MAHLDTVHKMGVFGRPPVRIEGDTIFRPGVVDCKGGAVEALLVLEALNGSQVPHHPVRVLFTTDEELDSRFSGAEGIRFIQENVKDAAAVSILSYRPSMNCDPVVFACTNTTPEIVREIALAAGAKIVATGRRDYPNQVNNVLALPGIFRGAIDVQAQVINEEMKMAASYAIADLISDDERCPEYIIPAALGQRVHSAVAQAVRNAAIQSGISRI